MLRIARFLAFCSFCFWDTAFVCALFSFSYWHQCGLMIPLHLVFLLLLHSAAQSLSLFAT
jgi:hypothetical protein